MVMSLAMCGTRSEANGSGLIRTIGIPKGRGRDFPDLVVVNSDNGLDPELDKTLILFSTADIEAWISERRAVLSEPASAIEPRYIETIGNGRPAPRAGQPNIKEKTKSIYRARLADGTALANNTREADAIIAILESDPNIWAKDMPKSKTIQEHIRQVQKEV